MSASDARALGQLLIHGLRDHRWSSSLERTLRTVQPGGILFFPECFRTPGQTAELLHKIARTPNTPPLLAITVEGGSVNPLKLFLPPLPTPRVLARRGPAAVRQSGVLIGSALRLLGFNLNFAPRLDLSKPDVKPALDTQTYGTDPKHVAACGKAFIEGLRKHKILACAKHFPGRSVPEYKEDGLPLVGKAMAELWREDLLPFRELLPHLPFIRLSNVSYKAYDFDVHQPAAMSSKVIHDLLRVKLGYRGVAVADLLGLMFEASPGGTSQQGLSVSLQAFILSVKAGCDLQVVNWGAKIAKLVLPGIQKELEGGSLTQERLEEASARIHAAKRGMRRPSGKFSARSFDRLAREFEEFNQRVRARGEIEN
jgi:beta-N-acetylhexosaminidase